MRFEANNDGSTANSKSGATTFKGKKKKKKKNGK